MPEDFSGRSSKHLPPVLRIKLALGYPFGLRRVSGRELAVVYRMGHFHGIRGPREFRLAPFVDVVRCVVDMSHKHLSITLDDLATKDGLHFSVPVELQYNFDPRQLAREKIMTAIRRVDQTGAESIVHDNAQAVMFQVFGKYTGEQVARNEATQAIQKEFLDLLAARLLGYGLHLHLNDCYARTFIPPAGLGRSLNEAAQRTVEMENVGQFTDREVQRGVAIKVAESLQHMPNGMPLIDAAQLAHQQPLEDAHSVRGLVLRGRTEIASYISGDANEATETRL